MKVRDKGPSWIVFPWSDRPTLENDKVRAWSVWQIKSIDVLAG